MSGRFLSAPLRATPQQNVSDQNTSPPASATEVGESRSGTTVSAVPPVIDTARTAPLIVQ